MRTAERMMLRAVEDGDSAADEMRRSVVESCSRRIIDDVPRWMSLADDAIERQRKQRKQRLFWLSRLFQPRQRIQQIQQRQRRQHSQQRQQWQRGQHSQQRQQRQHSQQIQQRQHSQQEQRFGCPVACRSSRSFIPFVRCLSLLFLFAGFEPRTATAYLSGPLINKEARACNTTSNGHIYSDGHYAPMMLHSVVLPVHVTSVCFYRFLGSSEQRIWIQIQQLVTGYYDYSSRSCRDGFLRVFDGAPEPGSHRYPPFTFCGQYDQMNATVFTSGHVAVVELHSQSDVISAYVVAVFKYVNIGSEAATFPRQIEHSMHLLKSTAYMCSWRITIEDCSDDECPLLSPGYPGSYPPRMECGYHISSRDADMAIQIKFHGLNSRHKPREFDIKSTDDCREEHLEIYDGDSTATPKIGRFCGNTMPDMTSSGSHLYVLFVSGPDTPRYGNVGFHGSVLGLTKEWHGGGQKASNRLCDWTFNVSEGSVSSPDHWLPTATKCTYVFHIHLHHRLDVVLNIYGLSASCSDYVEIYEGDRLVERFCESTIDGRMQNNGEEDAGKADTEAERHHPEEDDDDDEDETEDATRGVHRYSFHKTPVRFAYFTTRGQMQATPERGFWLSYKQLLADGGGGGGGGGGSSADESHRPLAAAKGDHRRMSNDEQQLPDYDHHHHHHYPTNSASSSFTFPFFTFSSSSFPSFSSYVGQPPGFAGLRTALAACLAYGHRLVVPLLPLLLLLFHLYYSAAFSSSSFSFSTTFSFPYSSFSSSIRNSPSSSSCSYISNSFLSFLLSLSIVLQVLLFLSLILFCLLLFLPFPLPLLLPLHFLLLRYLLILFLISHNHLLTRLLLQSLLLHLHLLQFLLVLLHLLLPVVCFMS